MPTYEFRCPKGHEFEKFYRSIGSAPSEVHCPDCGALAERQMSTGAGLVFKGSGFYITDYGKDGKKDQRQSPGKVSSGSSETSSKKSDAESSTPKSDSSASSSDTKSAPSSDPKPSSSAESKPAAAPAPAKKESK